MGHFPCNFAFEHSIINVDPLLRLFLNEIYCLSLKIEFLFFMTPRCQFFRVSIIQMKLFQVTTLFFLTRGQWLRPRALNALRGAAASGFPMRCKAHRAHASLACPPGKVCTFPRLTGS